ncbi:MAG: hypothetical protein RJA22_1566 [Verrucomicrobiota bacterium]|jgi:hypothetical protein
MKTTPRRATCLKALLALVSGLSIPFLAVGQTVPGKAEVRGITGTATYSVAGGPAGPLKVGMALASGAVIKTGPESTVDLFLGKSAGVVRVAEKSTFGLDRLTVTDTGADTAVDIQVNLPEGQMFFNVNKLSQASRYEIKVPNGVAGIRGTKGSGRSDSSWVLLDGTLIFVHAPTGGQPTPYVLRAPPAVIFTPTDGIKPAPEDLTLLTRRVVDQIPGRSGVVPPTGVPPGVPPAEPFVSPGTPPAQ